MHGAREVWQRFARCAPACRSFCADTMGVSGIVAGFGGADAASPRTSASSVTPKSALSCTRRSSSGTLASVSRFEID